MKTGAVVLQLDRVRNEVLRHCHVETAHSDETSAPGGRWSSFRWQLHSVPAGQPRRSATPVSDADGRPASRRLILIDLIKLLLLDLFYPSWWLVFFLLIKIHIRLFLRPCGRWRTGRRGTLRPFGAKRPCRHVAGWSHRCADTSNRRASFSMGRGQPVGPALATSSDGGGIAADFDSRCVPCRCSWPCVLGAA